jgi:hypothetical protein
MAMIHYYKGFSLHLHQNGSGWRTTYETWAAVGCETTVAHENGYPRSPWKRIGGHAYLAALAWDETEQARVMGMLTSYDEVSIPIITYGGRQ